MESSSPERKRRRFIVEVEGDFDLLTHPSDLAGAFDAMLTDDGWRVPNLHDFGGDPGCAVNECVLPEDYDSYPAR